MAIDQQGLQNRLQTILARGKRGGAHVDANSVSNKQQQINGEGQKLRDSGEIRLHLPDTSGIEYDNGAGFQLGE